MRKATLTGLVGLLLVVGPFLGVPEIWKTNGAIVAGVLLILLGYLFIRDRIYLESDLGNGERGNGSYVETTEPLFK